MGAKKILDMRLLVFGGQAAPLVPPADIEDDPLVLIILTQKNEQQ